MRDFNSLCKEFEELDVLSYGAILSEKAQSVIPALSAVTGNGLDGISVFLTFVMGAVAADGRLSEEEYLLCYPLLHAFFGDEVNFDDSKKALKRLQPESRELKKALDDMVDIFGLVSDALKEDLIVICMLICSVDGKISFKEKNWIKKLIK